MTGDPIPPGHGEPEPVSTPVETHRRGRCLDCGDEWRERGSIVVCPECHSTNVREIR